MNEDDDSNADARYPEVAEAIQRAFRVAKAAEMVAPALTPAERTRQMDEAFERIERAHGFNVVPFRRRSKPGIGSILKT